MIVSYNYYSNYAKYEGDKKGKIPLTNIKNLKVNRLSLFRSAVIVGLAPQGYKAISVEVKKWKIKTVDTFVDTSTKSLKFKNIQDLESSEKVAVSYLLGMVFAHLHMQKIYKIRHLEHLSNSKITPISFTGQKKQPDLWGFNRKRRKPISYLVEAKGTSKEHNYFELKAINRAVTQLSAIDEINYTTSKVGLRVFNKSKKNLKKLIVATHPNKKSEIIQKIIDPDNPERRKIDIDGDELVYKYYYHLIVWLKSEKNREITIKFNSEEKKFIVINISDTNISIGVLKEIYDFFNNIVVEEEDYKKKTYKKEDFVDSDYKINKYLNNLKGIDEFEGNISLGTDGVIAFENQKEKSAFMCIDGNLIEQKSVIK